MFFRAGGNLLRTLIGLREFLFWKKRRREQRIWNRRIVLREGERESEGGLRVKLLSLCPPLLKEPDLLRL